MAVKKTWYEIVAPKMFGEVPIGETLVFEPKNLIGRNIKVNLTDLGKEYSKFFMKMVFKVDNVEKNRASTRFVGHDVTSERIYRMVQRRARRVDCIADFTTADKQKIRLKIIAILTRRVGTSIKDVVRAKIKEVTEKYVSNIELEPLVKSIIADHLQRTIKEECKKIYPIGQVELRKSELL
ncbi:MAG: hypothetical protein HY831_00910 [Candidatus Aenigmarchaeota archaeon]|nr:hypothetical protein [Candidatus Aenigmarchaeota archaeon]